MQGPDRISGWRLLLATLLWPVCSLALLVSVLLPLRLFAVAWVGGHLADLGAMVLAAAYLGLLLSLAVCFGGRAGIRDPLRFRFTSWADLGFAWGAWGAALLVGLALTLALEPVLGRPASNAVPVLKRSFDPLFVALVVPTVALLAPLCEELLFRGALYGWLRLRLAVWLAAPVSALIFAGLHLLPPLLPFLFSFGLAAALVRERTGSTLNTFAMHAAQNTMATAAAYAVISSGRY